MVKRLFDIGFSVLVLVLLFPFLISIAVAVKLGSRGSIFYCATRAGLNGKPFKLLKFRTMIMGAEKAGKITAVVDDRVFGFGRFLRKTKLDELPQFLNVLKGDMSVVGPRPEDTYIVERYYRPQDMVTLSIRPGLVSPGSLYNYTHGDEFLEENNPMEAYVRNLLPVKLGLERVYLDKVGLIYDITIIIRSVTVIVKKILGKNKFYEPKEYFIATNKKFI